MESEAAIGCMDVPNSTSFAIVSLRDKLKRDDCGLVIVFEFGCSNPWRSEGITEAVAGRDGRTRDADVENRAEDVLLASNDFSFELENKMELTTSESICDCDFLGELFD